MATTLDAIVPGDVAIITGIDATCPDYLQKRLVSLGFSVGQEVGVERSAPLRDPVVYRICDQMLCLRKRDAAMIQVDPVTG